MNAFKIVEEISEEFGCGKGVMYAHHDQRLIAFKRIIVVQFIK